MKAARDGWLARRERAWLNGSRAREHIFKLESTSTQVSSPCSYYHHHHLGSRHRHQLFPLHHLVTVSALNCADYTLTQGERHFSTPPGFTLDPPCSRLEAPCALALP